MIKNDPSSWDSFFDLYPIHSMLLQNWQIGHAQFVLDIRQNPKVCEVFSKIWNIPSTELLTSFDAISFHLPPEKTKKGWYKKQ